MAKLRMPNLIELAELEQIQSEHEAKLKFPTYSAAIMEIMRLDKEISILKIQLALHLKPRKRGRPEKFDFSSNLFFDATPPARRGRPPNNTLQEMEEKIHALDEIKARYSKNGKPVTDKEIIEVLVKLKYKHLRIDKRAALTTNFRKKFKDFRYRTGRRQKTKANNSSHK